MHYQSDSRLQYDMVKIVSVLSYLTIVGWLVAALIYGNHKSALARFHLRQSLGLIITGALLAFIPLIGWALVVVLFMAWCVGIFHALNNQRYMLPVIGDFYQTHLDFIR